MKKMIVRKSKLNGQINAVSSKSLSHRYLIAAGLATGVSEVKNVLNSIDIQATTEILKNLGVDIKISDNNYIISSNGLKKSINDLNAYESGSTIRFFIPIVWTLDSVQRFIGTTTLGSRSFIVYDKIAAKYGYQFTKKKNNFPFTVKGPLKGGLYEVDATISSQFISGLLFALPLVKDDSFISLIGQVASRSYLDLTLKVLEESGIEIKEKDNGFFIKGNQKYQNISKTVEGDYSQIAFFIVASIITNSVITINNLNFNSLQGDMKIIDIIENIGVKTIKSENSLTILNDNDLHSADIDLYDIPDLGPILMVLAAHIKGTTIFRNIGRLYDKESNRLEAMKFNLEKQGVKFEIDEKINTLHIKGIGKFQGDIQFETFNDHRIAMALSVYGLNAEKEVVINDYKVINKSYPDFYDDLLILGGKINVFK